MPAVGRIAAGIVGQTGLPAKHPERGPRNTRKSAKAGPYLVAVTGGMAGAL